MVHLWTGYNTLIGTKTLIEEETDIKCLKEYSLRLLRENRRLSRKLSLFVNSTGNQNYTIAMLQDHIAMMNKKQSRLSELLAELSSVAVGAMARSRRIVSDISHSYNFEDLDKDIWREITELEKILSFVPLEDILEAKDKLLRFLHSLHYKDLIRDRPYERPANDEVPRRKRSPKSNQSKKSRKRSHPESNNFPASSSVGLKLPIQSQNGKSESKNVKRNNKRSRLSKSETEDNHLKKSTQKRGQKRKADKGEGASQPEVDEQSPKKNVHCDIEAPVTSPVPGSELNLLDDDIAQVRHVSVQLVDVLTDPAFEDDVYVSRVKQSLDNKDSDENEYEIVDDVSSDEDEEKQSDGCSESTSDREDDDDDKDGSKASSSQPLEPNDSDSEENAVDDNHADDEAASGVSSAEEEEEEEEENNDATIITDNDDDDADSNKGGKDDEEEMKDTFKEKENSSSNGKRGPQTPPLPPPYEYAGRGPHTPPGSAPDSEGPKSPPVFSDDSEENKKVEESEEF